MKSLILYTAISDRATRLQTISFFAFVKFNLPRYLSFNIVKELCSIHSRNSLLFIKTEKYKQFLSNRSGSKSIGKSSKKEVFQPHLPVRLPCYDLAPITSFALGRSLRSRTSGTPGFHGLTGGVYKARERIHRAMADARLLANPTSWSRVADSNPN